MKRQQLARILTLALCLGIWWFIFSNSMMNGEASTVRSDAVTGWVNQLLEILGLGTVGSFLIRKVAHFAEFAALGWSLALAADCWFPSAPLSRRSGLAVLVGAASAAADEGIQLFSQGRSARLTDLLIDGAGVLAGLLVLRLLQWLVIRRRHSAGER